MFDDAIFEGVDSPRNVGLAFEPLLLNENEMHLTAGACGQADENRAALLMRITWGASNVCRHIQRFAETGWTARREK